MAGVPDAGAKPARVRLRMYRVGFGDCFLLSFEYAAALNDNRSERHVLIDFGSTSLPTRLRDLVPIAKLINQHTAGKLDVVVVSHRHKDHLSAFGNSEIVDLLAKPGFPKLVVRSWTEDPTAKKKATGVGGGQHSAAVADKSIGFLTTLDRAEAFADRLANKAPTASRRSLAGILHQVANDQLRNADAVRVLQTWGKKGSAAYLHYGMPSGIEAFVPGVNVRVLGPPTVDQHPAVATQRSRDKDEFWNVYNKLVGQLGGLDLGADAEPDATNESPDGAAPQSQPGQPMGSDDVPLTTEGYGDPGPVRWLTDKMGRHRLNSLLRIVRILDDVLNNTSVILLFDVPGLKPLRLLFPGDAQIENWEYALKFAADKKTNLELLRAVDLYKVGHHGSRNATPRTLYNLWMEPATKDRPMTALMSTKANVHGDSIATAVPRATLVAALDTRMDLHSTQSLDSDHLYVELVADLATDTGFVQVPGE